MFAAIYQRNELHSAGNLLGSPRQTIERNSQPLHPRFRVAIGHVPYAMLRSRVPGDARFITMLRDPLERVVSHAYRHLLPIDGVDVRSRPLTVNSLTHALELGLPHVTNLQTRFFADDPDLTGRLQARALKQAKKNLERFAFVGIQERFDESVVLLEHALGFELTPYGINRHVNEERPSLAELPDDERELLAERNVLDVELYAWARERFDQLAAEPGDVLAAEVAQLKTATAARRETMTRLLEEARAWLSENIAPGEAQRVDDARAAAAADGIDVSSLKLASRELKFDTRTFDDDGNRLWTRPAAEAPPGASEV